MATALVLIGLVTALGPTFSDIAQALIRFRSERERRGLVERLTAEHGPAAVLMLGPLIPPEPPTTPGSRRHTGKPSTK